MVALNRITTKTGDSGTTGLADGSRCSKDGLRIAAIGDVDEANSSIGVLLSTIAGDFGRDLYPALQRIQNDLFDLGADLANPWSADEEPGKLLRVSEYQVSWLEDQVEGYSGDLAPLRSFILPGGTPASAWLHLVRSVARRAERSAWRLHQETPLNEYVLKYLNRLSDLMFCLARFANSNGAEDILWDSGRYQGE